MKPEVRVVGFDDAPFERSDPTVPVLGVVMRGGQYVEGVLRTDVDVDGDDATLRLAAAVNASRYKADLRAILVDGIAMGGFNVIDLNALHTATDVPVLSVTRGVPDMDAMRAALLKAFPDGERRWRLVERQAPTPLPTETSPVCVRPVGLTLEEAARVLALTTVRGLTPEPLRVAHLVATALVRGESRGL